MNLKLPALYEHLLTVVPDLLQRADKSRVSKQDAHSHPNNHTATRAKAIEQLASVIHADPAKASVTKLAALGSIIKEAAAQAILLQQLEHLKDVLKSGRFELENSAMYGICVKGSGGHPLLASLRFDANQDKIVDMQLAIPFNGLERSIVDSVFSGDHGTLFCCSGAEKALNADPAIIDTIKTAAAKANIRL